MTEAEALILGKGRWRRPDQLLADERGEMRLNAGSNRIGRQLRHCPTMEHLAFDGSALHDDAHVAVERVDASLEKRLDRGRNDHFVVAALAHHREHLLDVEGVAGRGDHDPFAQIGVERIGHEPLDQLLALLRAQRLEEERRRVHLPAAPPRPQIEKLGARDAEQEDRRVARVVGDVLDEVDEHRLGPLQVVDHDDLWALRGMGFEQPTKRELCLGWRRADDRIRVAADRDEDLDERPVRDPLAVREAAAAKDIGRVPDAIEEVGDEP